MTTKILIAATAALAATQLFAVTDARREECRAKARQITDQLSAMDCNRLLDGNSPGFPQFGIPRYCWWNEALHGYARCGLATVFPQAIGRAATFDLGVEKEVADIIAVEARAKYNNFQAMGATDQYMGLTLWSPNVNMFRDPRWGRGHETFGEDPYLTSRMGVTFVKGLQGDDPNYLKTSACAKHYAVHSGPEAKRHEFNVHIDKRDLYEYYLPAFKALVCEAKVDSVMGAYSAVNGVPCCCSKYLLKDILRDEWGFKGHVVSDVGACNDIWRNHKYVPTQWEASVACLEGGLDLCNDGAFYSMRGKLDRGDIPKKLVADAAVNLLATRYLLGNIGGEKTPWDNLGVKDIATPEHLAVSLKCAEKSIVLLKNNGVLPIDMAKTKRIALWGRHKDEGVLLGNYNGLPADPVSIYRAFLRELGPGKLIEENSHNGDVVIACIGLTPNDEGEGGDKKHINLRDEQLRLLRQDRKNRPNGKIVAVVYGGSCMDLREVTELCDAVLLAWYPGDQGGTAIYRTLAGLNNPAGRLPITFYGDTSKLPDFEDYKLPGRTYLYGTENVVYPFGYGLSYTSFAYGKIEVSGAGELASATRRGDAGTQPSSRLAPSRTAERSETAEGRADKTITISATVTNTGKVAGDEVVQLYVRSPEGSGDRRIHHLEGFTRVNLKPGETKTVSFTLKPEQLMQFGLDGQQSLAKGTYTFFVGGGQPGFAEDVQHAQLTF